MFSWDHMWAPGTHLISKKQSQVDKVWAKQPWKQHSTDVTNIYLIAVKKHVSGKLYNNIDTFDHLFLYNVYYI